MLVESVKIRCQQECFVDFNLISTGKPVAQLDNSKTKHACIVEADESMRIRMEGSQSKNHEEHISGKGVNSLSHFNLGAQIYSYASSHENARSTGSSGEIIAKL